MSSSQTWVAHEETGSETVDGVFWRYGRFVPAVLLPAPPLPSRRDIVELPPPAFDGSQVGVIHYTTEG